MSDDLDELLRRAMSALDRQVPDGYFDALPERTLARLDDPPALGDLDDLARERATRSARIQPVPPEELAASGDAAVDKSEPAAATTSAARAVRDAAPGSMLDAAHGAGRDAGARAGLDAAPRRLRGETPRAASGGVRDAAPEPTVRRRSRRAIVAVGTGLTAAVLVLLFVSPQMRTAMFPSRERGILSEASVRRNSQSEPTRTRSSQLDPTVEKLDPATPAPSVVPLQPPASSPEPPAPSPEPPPPPATTPAPLREPPALRAPPRATSRAPSPPRATSQRPSPAARDSSAGVLDPLASEQAGAPPAAERALDGASPPGGASSIEPDPGRAPPASSTHFTGAPEPSVADVEHAMRTLSPRLEACVQGAAGKIMVDAALLPSGRMSAVKLSAPFAGTAREACVRRVVESVHFPSFTGSPRPYRFAIIAPEVLSNPSARPSGGSASHR